MSDVGLSLFALHRANHRQPANDTERGSNAVPGCSQARSEPVYRRARRRGVRNSVAGQRRFQFSLQHEPAGHIVVVTPAQRGARADVPKAGRFRSGNSVSWHGRLSSRRSALR